MRYLSILLIVVVSAGAKFPVPIFPDVSFPTPVWTAETVTVVAEKVIEPEVKHTGKPTVRPMRIPHSVNMYVCACSDGMCRGQHLRNWHGRTYAEANKELQRWSRYHPELHQTQAKPKVQQATGQYCEGGGRPGGNCGRRRLFGRWR